MGEGDTSKAQDVSHQIENEEQILGAKTQEQRESEKVDDEGGGEVNEAEGIEMNDNFDGEMQDVPKDADDDADEDEVRLALGDAFFKFRFPTLKKIERMVLVHRKLCMELDMIRLRNEGSFVLSVTRESNYRRGKNRSSRRR
jgi:hypothetical protein